MRYYPVNLDVRNRECLVVGGGGVGERKVRTLLECEAIVTVVTLLATESLRALASGSSIKLEKKEYEPSDMEGKFLVIGATDNEAVNEEVRKRLARMLPSGGFFVILRIALRPAILSCRPLSARVTC